MYKGVNEDIKRKWVLSISVHHLQVMAVPSQDIDDTEQNNTYDVAQYVHMGGKRPKEHKNQSPKIKEKKKKKKKSPRIC